MQFMYKITYFHALNPKAEFHFWISLNSIENRAQRFYALI